MVRTACALKGSAALQFFYAANENAFKTSHLDIKVSKKSSRAGAKAAVSVEGR